MAQSYELTGVMSDDHTLTLDQPLPISGSKVRVVVEVIDAPTKPSYEEVMEMIWARQRECGHVPPTREEVDARVNEERNSWDT